MHEEANFNGQIGDRGVVTKHLIPIIPVIFSHSKSDAKGVLIAFHEHVNVKIIVKYLDISGRYIVLNAEINNFLMILVNYCAPNYEAEQVNLVEDLTGIFDQPNISENTKSIWGGVSNLTFDINLDADGGSQKLYIKSTTKLLSICLKTIFVIFIESETLITGDPRGVRKRLSNKEGWIFFSYQTASKKLLKL